MMFNGNVQDLDVENYPNIPSNDVDKPVILIFGWTGASHRHLNAYTKMYGEKGFKTSVYICPMKYLLWRQSGLIPFGEKIIQDLATSNSENKICIVHIFSNGGSFIHEYFMKALAKKHLPITVKGVIFDSAPGKTIFFSFYRALLKIYALPSDVTNKVLSVLVCSLFFTWWSLKDVLGRILNKDFITWEPFENLKNEASSCPQHFIYSRTDRLVDYKHIEEFMNIRRLHGIQVTSTVFENSEHVRHYPSNKLRYCKSVFQFINKCLKK